MNVVFAFAIASLIYFVGLPVPDSQPIIGMVDPASAEGKMGIREGDRVVMVDNKPIKNLGRCHGVHPDQPAQT